MSEKEKVNFKQKVSEAHRLLDGLKKGICPSCGRRLKEPVKKQNFHRYCDECGSRYFTIEKEKLDTAEEFDGTKYSLIVLRGDEKK